MDTGKITIRRAIPNDLNVIGDLWREFMDFHKRCDPHFSRSVDGHEQFKEFVSRHISLSTSCVLIAESNGKIVGYCLATLAKYPPVFETQDYGAVFDLAVNEHYRRNGIGEMLYRAVQDWFVERGIHRVETRAVVSNETSTEFWKKMGFSPSMTVVSKNI